MENLFEVAIAGSPGRWPDEAVSCSVYREGWGCQPVRVKPRIRYCQTPAGRVAYSTAGDGPPLLYDSGWITDLRGQLELLSFSDFIGGLAERFTVIRYDKPGCGLSDRDGIDLSFDGQVAAALAVADAVRADRFSLFGASQAGQLAAAIAARCPERVEAHVENIRRKLEVRSRAQIAAWITEHRPAAERRAAT